MVPVTIILTIQGLGIAFLDPMQYNDSREYLAISRSMVAGTGYSITSSPLEGIDSFQGEIPTRMRQPLYPLFLVATYWWMGKSTLCVQMTQVLLNLFAFYLLFRIAQRSFQNRLWLGSLIGLALYFPVWLASVFILTETLFIFLVVLSMSFLQTALERQRLMYFALSGAVLGAATLTRPIGVSLILLSFLVIWNHRMLRKALADWAILAVFAALVLFPWFLRNATVLGDFTPLSSEGGYGLWASTLKPGESDWHDSEDFRSAVQNGYYLGREANRRFTQLALKNIASDPICYAWSGVKRVGRAWSYFPGSMTDPLHGWIFALAQAVQYLLLLFALLGLFSGLGVRGIAFYLFPAVALSSMIYFHSGHSRFVVPAMPFVVILAGQGFWDVFWGTVRKKMLRHRI